MRRQLSDPTVRLRPLTEADLPQRAVWTSDDELAVLMGADPAEEPFTSLEDEVRGNCEWLAGRQRAGAHVYAIVAEGRYIGDIDVTLVPRERKAELTLFIGDRSQWRKGYGTETVQLIVAELFRDASVDGVEVEIAPGNERAYRFWRKLGFEQYGADAKGTRFLRLMRGQSCARMGTESNRVCDNQSSNDG